jgi:hypothetical protein
MQQRYYDPVAARFLSNDPVVTDANTGGAFNRFNYANNNPYRFTDPDGREPDTPELPRSPIPPPADIKLLGQAMYKVLDTLSQPLQQGLNAIINAVSGGSEGSAPATPTAPAAGKGSGGDKDASTPTGQRGSPMDVPKGTNQPANIGGQEYGGHALDQMQGRGVTPTPVADTVQNGTQTPGNKPGRTVHTGQDGRLVVVTEGGKVVTVITK